MTRTTKRMLFLAFLISFSVYTYAQDGTVQAESIGTGGAAPTSAFGLYSKKNLKLEDQTNIEIEFWSSTTNSSGGIMKVGSIGYNDPNGGTAFTNDDLQISNIASTTGDIEFFTLRDPSNVNSMKFEGGNNGNANAFQILHSNNISLTLQGDGDMTIAGNLTENSDIKLKKDLQRITSVLPSLGNIFAYRYKWLSPNRGQELQIGLVAQEVQKVYPELVQQSEEGILSVSYTKFVPLLVEAVKEQQSEIQKLRDQISERDEAMKEIKVMIEELTHRLEKSELQKID